MLSTLWPVLPLKGDGRRRTRFYHLALSGGLFAHERLAVFCHAPWLLLIARVRERYCCNATWLRASGQQAGRRRCAQLVPCPLPGLERRAR